MRSKINITLYIITLSFFSCTSQSPRYDKDQTFVEFYELFYSDKPFQKSRVVFPLPGYNSDYDNGIPSDVAEMLGYEISNEYFWKLEKWEDLDNSMDEKKGVKMELILSDTLVTEERIIPNSGYTTIRKFRKKDGRWFLVYYFYQNI